MKMNKYIVNYFIVVFSFFNVALWANDKNNVHTISIMPIGDSITEGTAESYSYMYTLWEELFKTGINFKFIGPRYTDTRIGRLNHCAFSGKTAEFLDTVIDSIYRRYPADIVLLHAGHNHFTLEHPVPGIMRAYKSIVGKIMKINPEVKIVVSKIIPSGKLPKYLYINELNDSIENFISSLSSSNLVLADPYTGFITDEYTVTDKVHTNEKGANHIAMTFKRVISRIYGIDDDIYNPDLVQYKNLENGDSLSLHVFSPKNYNGSRPCILYFFGGGWSRGTPLQFYRECSYYSSKGIVAISVDYRISYSYNSTPLQSLEDACDAILWIKANAHKLGIDKSKIAVAGASAGGQLAAALGTSAMKQNFDCRPDLMLLYYPVIDNSPNGYGTRELKEKYKLISPLHNVTSNTPPSLLLLGTHDHIIPISTCEDFEQKLINKGIYCELRLFKQRGHPIFNYREPLNDDFYRVREMTDKFLKRFGFLN